MNPIEKVTQKEGEYEINALRGPEAVFLRAKSSRALLRKRYRAIYQRLTMIRKDGESAGGHR
jgi:hypothetical protein